MNLVIIILNHKREFYHRYQPKKSGHSLTSKDLLAEVSCCTVTKNDERMIDHYLCAETPLLSADALLLTLGCISGIDHEK